MNKYILSAILIFNFANAFGQNENYNYQDVTALLNVWLEAQKDYEDIPAIMGVAVKDQDVIWSGSFGKSNVEEDIESNINTACSVCSVSKVFTATAIMKLVSEEKLQLDQEIKDILPFYSIKQAFPDGGNVTIESLLTHSSGVPRDTKHSYWSGPDFPFPSKEELVKNLSEMETIYAVGTDIQYSNLGYALLGLVIEEISGISYKKYIETEIFQPLGMHNSVVEMQKSTYGNEHAFGYTASNRNGSRKRASFYQTRAMQPAAGISTSALDLAKFASWQFRLMDATEPELLTPAALKRMYEIQATNENGRAKRGFGYEVFTDSEGNKWVMHGGICPGYVSFFKMNVTNKMAYTILVNANRVRALRYVNSVIEIFNKAESISQSKTKKNDLSEYAGFYDLTPWNSEYYISPWGDGLVALYLPTESVKYALYFYKHKEDDVFQLINEQNELTGEELIFHRNEIGIITKVRNEGNFHYRK